MHASRPPGPSSPKKMPTQRQARPEPEQVACENRWLNDAECAKRKQLRKLPRITSHRPRGLFTVATLRGDAFVGVTLQIMMDVTPVCSIHGPKSHKLRWRRWMSPKPINSYGLGTTFLPHPALSGIIRSASLRFGQLFAAGKCPSHGLVHDGTPQRGPGSHQETNPMGFSVQRRLFRKNGPKS